MKNKKIIIAIVCVCVLALTVGIGLYVRNAQLATEVKGGITLDIGGKSVSVALSELNQVAFEGETVNGKGDRSTHAYRGIELRKLLEAKGTDLAKVTAVTASSADQYTAELTGEEVREEDKVYIVVEMDGNKVPGIDEGTDGAQMVVFGDQNSRRNVRFLSIVTVSAN